MQRGLFRGHGIIWKGEKFSNNGVWVYEDTLEPIPGWGGKTRPCKKCGKETTLGDGDVDPCLGILPGVDNACCGNGVRELSYIRFSNGLVIKGFEIEDF